MEKITGQESAFPYIGDITHNPQFDSVPGMNLRTYIATQAMVAVLNSYAHRALNADPIEVAVKALKHTDALLNELNK